MINFKIQRYVCVQTLIAAGLNLGEIIIGYGVSWSAPILPKLEDPTQSPLPPGLTELQKSWIAAAIYFGCLGSYFGGFFSNMIGRKKSFMMGGVVTLMAYVLLTYAYNLNMLYVGRLFLGIGMSWISLVGIIYMGEIASSNLRGIFLTSMGVSHALGGLFVYSVGPFVTYACVCYIIIGVNIVYIIICNFLPESPMYHVLKDDEKSARDSLEYLGRSDDISTELKMMMEKARQQQNTKAIWKELFLLKCNRKSLFIMMFLTFFQNSSGIMAVLFFSTTIFQYAKSSIQPEIATIIIGATCVVGTFGAPMFIEKYGRRILLIVSTLGLCISMAVLGLYFYLRETNLPSVEQLGWIPLLLLVFVIFAYSVGLNIIPNTLAGELFTQKVRGVGPSISFCSGWLFAFIFITIFSIVVEAFGIHYSFWMFSCFNFLGFMFAVLFVPETKGKSLMEIQYMLEK